MSVSRRVSKEDSGIDRRAGEQEAGVTGAVVVEEKKKNEVEEDSESIKKVIEFNISSCCSYCCWSFLINIYTYSSYMQLIDIYKQTSV